MEEVHCGDELPVEVIGTIGSYLPVLPYLFLFQRVCKTWQQALDNHLHQHRDATHLHFGHSDIILENMSQEQFMSIVKRCGAYTKKITIPSINVTENFSQDLVQTLEDSKAQVEELVFAYIQYSSSGFLFHKFFQLMPTLQRIVIVSNSNFTERTYYSFRIDSAKEITKIDLQEYNDDGYLAMVKKYQLETVITSEEFSSRFYNEEEPSEFKILYHFAGADDLAFGIYEPWNTIKKFYITNPLLRTNEILDKPRGFTIGHAYMATILAYLPAKINYFKIKKDAQDSFEKWKDSPIILDMKTALTALVARGLNLNQKNRLKPGKSVLEMAQTIDEQWLKTFKKFGIKKCDFSIEEFLREKSGIPAREKASSKKNKRKSRDEDEDEYHEDEEDDEDAEPSDEDSDDEYEEKPKRTRSQLSTKQPRKRRK
jgi:ribosomal protein L12E/L44/L45/RPP1/RPP2